MNHFALGLSKQIPQLDCPISAVGGGDGRSPPHSVHLERMRAVQHAQPPDRGAMVMRNFAGQFAGQKVPDKEPLAGADRHSFLVVVEHRHAPDLVVILQRVRALAGAQLPDFAGLVPAGRDEVSAVTMPDGAAEHAAPVDQIRVAAQRVDAFGALGRTAIAVVDLPDADSRVFGAGEGPLSIIVEDSASADVLAAVFVRAESQLARLSFPVPDLHLLGS